jgi:transcriptional regulator with XRE-family HTH domain
MNEFKAFGERVRELRQEAKFTQEELAALCELDRTYISGIERGQRNPALRNILRISKALGISPSTLFEGL